MKIALPTRNGYIDSHFGHCDYFTVFSLNQEKELDGEDIIQSPQGCGCKSNIAGVLAEMGVTLMLAGNMGQGAVNVLNSHGISVIRGCSGAVKEVLQAWVEGKIQDNGIVCDDHHSCNH